MRIVATDAAGKDVLKNLVPIVAACLLLLIIWASAIPLYHWFESSQQSDPLKENMEKWRSHGIDSYEYVVEKSCDCVAPGNLPIKIVVRDSLNIAAYDNRNSFNASDPRVEGVPRTIPELFGLLRESTDVSTVTGVDYDETFGFPRGFAVGFSSQQVTYTVTEFNILTEYQ